jgi:hypothetical protein
MGNVAIGENNLVHIIFFNQLGQLFLRIYRDSFGVISPSDTSRVYPAFNIGYLCSGKCYHLVVAIAAEIGIKIMKIPAGCSHYDYALFFHFTYLFSL